MKNAPGVAEAENPAPDEIRSQAIKALLRGLGAMQTAFGLEGCSSYPDHAIRIQAAQALLLITDDQRSGLAPANPEKKKDSNLTNFPRSDKS
jgi:hypothetical protein